MHRTPVVTCRSLDEAVGARLFFQCENLQRAGAFKMRGASNAVFSLDGGAAARGVATHSSGNHAQALALAARNRGIPAHVVMPSNAPAIKRAAVEGYGGRITWCAPTLAARENTLRRVVADPGATFIHPYDDYRIIAGQGTAALELLEEVPDLDAVVVPVGGGGLAAGTCLAVHGLAPRAAVVAAEPRNADDAFRSLREGRIVPSNDPQTIADGLRTSLGTRTFPILRAHLARVALASEESIVRAMRLLWERAKLVVEPSGAVPLAALLEDPGDLRGRRVGVILSGGNVDLDRLPWLVAPGRA
ncbi:MAG: pyridoxal-phosphate dependent enzyme [Myxococcales bacterium]|nr:pyridoxal-phosphate dependent enzyme [Myxococcales bacterium]